MATFEVTITFKTTVEASDVKTKAEAIRQVQEMVHLDELISNEDDWSYKAKKVSDED